MPPRDKKATGYRLEPSIVEERLKAVRLMFELYDGGMTFANISDNLWKQGLGHYDKPFGYHGVEVILTNSAYIGLPAWGKLGVGAYRICMDKQPKQHKRKKDDPLVLKKAEEQYIFPLRPVFTPIIKEELFRSVKATLADRGHVNASFGKRRTRDKEQHPLNGKVVCPDCHKPMVLGAFQPKVGEKHRCFVCGTYRKTIRTKCHANTVRWELLDQATDELLATVKDRIEMVEQGNIEELRQAEWLKMTELGRIIETIVQQVEVNLNSHETLNRVNKSLRTKIEGITLGFETGKPGAKKLLSIAFELYAKDAEENMQSLKEEFANVNDQLDTIAEEFSKGISSQSVRNALNNKSAKLEARKAVLEQQLVPLTDKANALIDQLRAIKKTIGATNLIQRARLLDSFIEKVVPIFDVQEKCKDGKRRAYVRGFTFYPKETAGNVLPEPMKIGSVRTDRGSSPRRARNGRETWTSSMPARSSLCLLPTADATLRDCGD